jgi:hypothetical protein
MAVDANMAMSLQNSPPTTDSCCQRIFIKQKWNGIEIKALKVELLEL